jgi:hypothetical protein
MILVIFRLHIEDDYIIRYSIHEILYVSEALVVIYCYFNEFYASKVTSQLMVLKNWLFRFLHSIILALYY